MFRLCIGLLLPCAAADAPSPPFMLAGRPNWPPAPAAPPAVAPPPSPLQLGTVLSVGLTIITHPWTWTVFLPDYWGLFVGIIILLIVNQVGNHSVPSFWSHRAH